MASVFWDGQGIMFIDYVKKEGTINSEYYIALLERLKAAFKRKRPHMTQKRICLIKTIHLVQTRAKPHELKFEVLLHSPYSADLAPSDYSLFANLKTMLDKWNWGLLWGKKWIDLQERSWEQHWNDCVIFKEKTNIFC